MLKVIIIACLILLSLAENVLQSSNLDSFFAISRIGSKQNSETLKANFNDDSGKCRDAIKETLTPEKLGTLQTMIMNTGKSVNQYGNPDACRDNPETEYVIFQVKGAPIVIEIGVCSPSDCNSEEAYSYMTNYANDIIKDMGLGDGFSVQVSLPYQADNSRLNLGAWVVIILTSIIVLFGCIGIFVEYVTLFDKPGSVPTMKKDERLSRLGLVFYSFSFRNNLEKLFTVDDRGDSNLKIINGIRVFSICWVITGHVFMNLTGSPITNLLTVLNITEKWYFALVPGGFFAVDVFFYMSGFLTFYLLTQRLYPRRGIDNYPMIYFHRWYRLVIPSGFCMLISMYAFKYWGSGPRYSDSWNMGNCEKTWWANILFINNLYPWEVQNMCMAWYWYLANDFEFFLISPIIIFIYCKSRYLGYATLVLCLLTNFLFAMIVTAKYDFGIFVTLQDTEDVMHWLYFKPWARFGPYGIGALIGWGYFEYKQSRASLRPNQHPTFNNSVWTKLFMSYKISSVVSFASFIIGLTITSFLVFIQHDFYKSQLAENPWDKFPCMLFNAFSRSGFVFGLTLIILPTFENRLSWIKSLLSSDFMCVLGRLTYAVYLINIPWIIVLLADMRTGVWVNNTSLWFITFAVTIISFLFAVPYSMICEVPFMNLEKYFLMPRKKPKANIPRMEKHAQNLSSENTLDTEKETQALLKDNDK